MRSLDVKLRGFILGSIVARMVSEALSGKVRNVKQVCAADSEKGERETLELRKVGGRNDSAIIPRHSVARPRFPARLACLLLRTAICVFAADETGQPAPRFRAKATTRDQFNNASVKGKDVLFEFWTTCAGVLPVYSASFRSAIQVSLLVSDQHSTFHTSLNPCGRR